MKLTIQQRHGKLPSSLKESIERKLLFAMSRFTPMVERVSVVLSDQNGPKGGHDQACRVTAYLRHGEILTISDSDLQIEPSVARAIDRLARAVARHLDRLREGRKSRFSAADFAQELPTSRDV